MELTRAEAARVAVHFQRLDASRPRATHDSVLDTVRGLGYLQLDTISAVERTHHLVLHSRLKGYRGRLLDDLLYEGRTLCDYWTNVAAIVPVEDREAYRYCWTAHRDGWRSVSRSFLDEILRKSPKDRPFDVDDFDEEMQGRTPGTWSSSRLRNALDILVLEGSLMVHHREKFRKTFTHCPAPPKRLRPSSRSDCEVARFLLRRSLSAMGIGGLREIMVARLLPARVYRREAQRMVREGLLERARIQGVPDDCYVLSERKPEVEKAAAEHTTDAVASLLSPFDNLLINRQRTLILFGFRARFEGYVPQARREYGYFMMPLLWGERLIGYADPKLDRKAGIMTFHTIKVQPTEVKRALPALVEEFVRFLQFHDARRLSIKRSEPRFVAREVETSVNRAV